MVHNGIEYGLMQAYAEGFDILKNANIDALPAEHRFDLDIADIAEVWRRGSVIPSWLLDLTASRWPKIQTLENYSGFVEDSGEGRWTVNAAIDEAVPAEVLTAALYRALPLAQGAHLRREDPLRDARRLRRPQGAAAAPDRRAEAPESSSRRLIDDSQSAQQKKPDPCSFVIFGVTGDLAHRLVIPALYNLAANDLLPDNFCVVGVARKGMSSDELRDSLMKGLHQFATRKVDDAIAKRLLACVTCIEADPKDPASFDAHARAARQARGRAGRPAAIACSTWRRRRTPSCRSASELGRTGMLTENGSWRRLVVEKPFGTDLASAKALNSELLKLVDEHQIYRIDHYLGKETVQNILVLRFANGMFEPIWNRNHIDHIQITVDEKLGVGHRGSFYDATGALRDMVPNHLFQLLSLVAMEPPTQLRRAFGALGKGRGAGGDPDPERGGGAAEFGARAISGRQGRRHRDRGLSQDRGRQARQHHRDLCRAEADHRQLALGRRAVLSAHRQGARRQAHRDRDQVQAGAVRDVPRHAGGPAVAELS